MSRPLFEALCRFPAAPVYHYTSHTALKKILESGDMWFTDARFLNDSSEIRHVFELARKVIDAVDSSPGDRRYCTTVREFLNEAILPDKLSVFEHPYVSSFCEDRDSLTLWRSYCPEDGGYSVGLDWSHNERPDDLFIGKCIYKLSEKKDVILETFEYFKKCPMDEVDENTKFYGFLDRARIYIRRASAFLHELSSCLAPIMKDLSFVDEREWRVFTRGGVSTQVTQFRPLRTMLAPYKAQPLSLDPVVHLAEIMVGPCVSPMLAKTGLEAFIKSFADPMGRRVVQCESGVNVSTIPYRAQSL